MVPSYLEIPFDMDKASGALQSWLLYTIKVLDAGFDTYDGGS
jgi:hypothetical protein